MKTVCIYNVGVGNTELLVRKIIIWQKSGVKVKMVCPKSVVSDFSKLVKDIEFIAIPFCRLQSNKIKLIFELIKRSLVTCWYIPAITKNNPTIYSISSVLDALIVPCLIKLIKPKIRWVALFENEVYLKRPGPIVVRYLAYFFYLVSLSLLKKADTIFIITNELRTTLIKKGWPKDRLIITGNAVDSSRINKAIKTQKDWCDGLFMGRIDELKGVFDLVRICRKVIKVFPEFSLWIAGSGDLKTENDLRRQIKGNHLERNIKLLGYVSGFKKFRLLANTKLFLFPSYSESFGVALLEAVCSGKKSIAYDLAPYRNIYQNHEIITVPTGDWDGFADKVIEILKLNTFINRPGLELQKSSRYTYENIALTELNNMFL